MKVRARRILALAVMAATLLPALAVPASAGGNGMTQLDGVGEPDLGGACTELPADFASTVSGDLVGCVYITVVSGTLTPSGVLQESGTEVFVGCTGDGELCGTIDFTYIFRGKFALDFSEQYHGRCQHPMVGGTGDFAGVEGRLSYHDDVAAGVFPFNGHFRLP